MRESVNGFKTLGNDLVGVEIGVCKGESALGMLQNLPIKMLYLVDPYVEYEEYNITEISGCPNMDENEASAKELLKDYEGRITWSRKKSNDAVNDIPNDLDFVYIDGNHAGGYVKMDIENYYPKVKDGGILAGHDFQKIEIRDSVLEFNKGRNHDLYSFPFEKANHIHDWDEEWRLYRVPSGRISIDQEDWWLIKK